ncbi:LuxR C-terminal-related transcriptional regulator [Fictibacillus gelatini]|uniref:LuxR C-terminal-related transcriptional regulator n=1 Tax=Fictibacillus gelatini TaxID=225985 RepID=UPI0006869B85|nr:LuxR C-terminal-related transcriptional regulator [Fictibacillus gelatini]
MLKRKEIEDALRDYHWMIKEIDRLHEELATANTSCTTQYGIEASLPKANGNSDTVGREVINRERKRRTLTKLEAKVQFIENNMACIEDARQLTVLNCMLDGMNIVSISQHMGFSERTVYTIKDEIVKRMKENAEIAENAGITGKLNVS